jgi:hypothetical protein
LATGASFYHQTPQISVAYFTKLHRDRLSIAADLNTVNIDRGGGIWQIYGDRDSGWQGEWIEGEKLFIRRCSDTR